MRLYPLALKLEGRRCVVAGGGRVAERKVASLLECGAHVTVVSPEVASGLRDLAARGKVEVIERAFASGDAAGALLVIAATDDRAVNEAVVAAAHAAGALVNIVDVPELCDFYVPSSFSRGDLQFAVCTGGDFPALSKKLRLAIEKQFGPEYEQYVALLGKFRAEVKARIQDRRRRVEAEEALLEAPALAFLVQGRPEHAERVLAECVDRFARGSLSDRDGKE